MGKYHGPLAKAGRVKDMVPRYDEEDPKPKPNGRARRRKQFTKRKEERTNLHPIFHNTYNNSTRANFEKQKAQLKRRTTFYSSSATVAKRWAFQKPQLRKPPTYFGRGTFQLPAFNRIWTPNATIQPDQFFPKLIRHSAKFPRFPHKFRLHNRVVGWQNSLRRNVK